jgi:hypothetical protein
MPVILRNYCNDCTTTHTSFSCGHIRTLRMPPCSSCQRPDGNPYGTHPKNETTLTYSPCTECRTTWRATTNQFTRICEFRCVARYVLFRCGRIEAHKTNDLREGGCESCRTGKSVPNRFFLTLVKDCAYCTVVLCREMIIQQGGKNHGRHGYVFLDAGDNARLENVCRNSGDCTFCVVRMNYHFTPSHDWIETWL